MTGLVAMSPRPIAVAFGAAVALRLARSGPVAVVVLRERATPPVKVPAPPPTLAAARAAASIRRAGHPATAAWRLVRCEVDSVQEVEDLIPLLESLAIPHVVVPAGGRSPEVDRALERFADWVAGAEEPVGIAALDSLGANSCPRVRIHRMVLDRSGASAALAIAGIGAPAAWVERIDDALDAADGKRGEREVARGTGDAGQALPLWVAVMAAALSAVVVAMGVAAGSTALAKRQAIADVAAVAGADALRLGRPPGEAQGVAEAVAGANGMRSEVEVPDRTAQVPSRVRVRVVEPLAVGGNVPAIPVVRTAEAMVAIPAGHGVDPGPGDYAGPFAWRQGKPMRPDVAIAFDRMADAAARSGLRLSIASAWRSSAEQARLFAARPDPKWVAPPGRSLHRLGTELDLGPPAAYGWLARNAGAFGFLRRYHWEPWHFGYMRSPGSTSVGFGRRDGGRPRTGALQAWVPARYRQTILAAASRHGVSAALLAAQIRAESDFRPRIVSRAGARGISQLMPGEARRLGVDPFDPDAAIGAQARLMAELLSRFGAVPLALAAYNAGPGAVARYGGIPPYPETRAYVARILAWLGEGGAAGSPAIVLVA